METFLRTNFSPVKCWAHYKNKTSIYTFILRNFL